MTDRDFKAGEILLFDKPFDWSSFDLVKKVKNLLRKKYGEKIKVGHAGTLDPYATGLLVICTGKMTKKIALIQDAEKEYTGTFIAGATTASYDLETEPDTFYPTDHITTEKIELVRSQFLGPFMQQPPVFSAKKIDGKRAYQLARKGKEVTLEPRPVVVYEFWLGEPVKKEVFLEIPFRVVCSKGTYIRSLAYDFGKALGSGAYLASLRRTRIGEYTIENATDLETFTKDQADPGDPSV